MALHASSLAAGKGIYFGLQGYPYTVSPYMPLFYLLAAGLERVGLPMLLCGRLLRLYTLDRYAIQAGTLLIASTANLLFWGTVGQVDMLGILFSLVAFYNYSKYRVDQQGRRLVWAGLFVLLAALTKQTMLAAGATIFLLLAREQRRRAAQFAVAVASCGAFLALALNHFTGGHFFENTLWANLNPFSDMKLAQQIRYLAMAGGALAVVALAGLRASFRAGIHPFYIYLAAAAAVLAATGSKIGADLNYQLEIGIALGLCAGWTLHRLDFFPRCFRGDRGAVTLLQIPVLLHIVLNLGITGKLMLERLIEEPVRRQEYATLRPYLEASRGPVISVQLDPLLQAGRRIEVEPLIYTLLVETGRVDPEPVRRDLAERKFGLVILYEDLFAGTAGRRDPELPSLPSAHLEEIRRHYRLVRHVAGPSLNGDYLYQPIDASATRSTGWAPPRGVSPRKSARAKLLPPGPGPIPCTFPP